MKERLFSLMVLAGLVVAAQGQFSVTPEYVSPLQHRLRFAANVGSRYRVWRSTNALSNSPTWQDVSGMCTASTASIAWSTDTAAIPGGGVAATVFYKVSRLPSQSGDSLAWVSVPPSAQVGKNVSVSLDYAASDSGRQKHVYAGIAPAGTRNWIGVSSVAVTPGAGRLDLTFRLLSDPPDGDVRPYVFSAVILEETTGPWQATASAPEQPVTIVPPDVLEFLAASNRVERGNVYPVTLRYRVGEPSYLKVDLLRSGAPVGQDWFGGTSQVLSAGSGTSTVFVGVEGYPAGSNDYLWSAFVGPSLDWTQASASAQYTSVTVVADSLSIASAPSPVRLNQDITVSFDYTANPGVAKRAYVSILQSNTWDWIGGTNVALAVGTGTTSVTFRLDHAATNTAPYPYVYSAFIAPAGGGYADATALAGTRPVSVVVDRVWFVSATSTVENGRTYDIRIGHQLESNGYVKVDLLKPGAPVGQDWFGGTGVVAAAGIWTSTLSVTVSGHPPAGGGYQWSAFVGPTLDYSNSTASAQSNHITVIADSLSIASAPAVVNPGQTVSVTMAYTAHPGLAKHVQVSLLAPSQGYAWYGGVGQAVVSGSGQVTVQFTVEGRPPSGSDYVVDAFLAPDGQQWDGATANAQQAVTVHSDAISFQSYPPSIWTPQTWDVQIAYTVWDTRVIQVNLLTPAPAYTYRAHGTVTVGPGSGIATVQVAVPDTFDSGTHIWSAFSAPSGGSWETRTAEAASAEIWVTRGAGGN